MKQRLLAIVFAAVAPLALVIGAGLLLLIRDQWQTTQRRSLDVARTSAAAIDTELNRTVARLRAMAESPMLEHGDLQGLKLHYDRVRSTMPDWQTLLLVSADGSVLIQADAGSAAAPEPLPGAGLSELGPATTRHETAVGAAVRLEDGSWVVPVRVPVLRDGQLLYRLVALVQPETIVKVLHAQRLPETWLVSVFDANRVRVARTHDHDRQLGRTGSATLLALLDRGGTEGGGITLTLEGVRGYTSFVTLPNSGWIVATAIPTATVVADAAWGLMMYGAGLGGSILLAWWAAVRATRRISDPIIQLRMAAVALGQGTTPELPQTDIQEIQQLGAALLASSAAHHAAERERQRALSELVLSQQDLREQLADQQRLHQLSSRLLHLRGLNAQLHAVLKALCELHGSRSGSVSLLDMDGERLHLRSAIGLSETARDRLRHLAKGEAACGMVAQRGQRVVIEDVETDPRCEGFRALARSEGFCAVHSTPLLDGDECVLGVLTVYLPTARSPTPRELRLAELCSQLSAVFVARTRAEMDAEQSEQRLYVALDSSTVPFSILAPVRNAAGTIVDFVWEYVNRAAAAALQRPATQILGHRMRDVPVEAWADPSLLETYTEIVENGQVHSWTLCTAYHRQQQWFQVVATPFSDKVAVWCSDITRLKNQENALQIADRRKDEFIATLAHELRNPLAPIQQAVMILRSTTATDAQRQRSHDVIERQIKLMALLLDGLLDISRISRGRLELNRGRVPLRQVVAAAIETAHPQLDARQHRLRVSMDEAPVWIDADEVRVAQVIINLLTNSARYTKPGGEIRLFAGVRDQRAVVEVQDNGIGIPPKHLESIFQMFSQVGAKRATTDSGLGIGLALSRGIAELHGGTLIAESQGLGQGTRMTLSLPLSEVEDTAPASAVPKPAAHPNRRRILVADDNRDAADTLASFLQLDGHEVDVVYDGEQAVQQYQLRLPDVVLLDIGMPKLDGHQAAQRIRALSAAAAHAPLLIALTGWGQDRDKADAMHAGFDHHLTKPVDPETLLQLLSGE